MGEERAVQNLSHLRRKSLFQTFALRALLPVAATYCMSAIGSVWLGPAVDLNPGIRAGRGLGLTGIGVLFTCTHAILPVFIYRAAIKRPAARLFVTLHMGLWFGTPIVGLALMTSWLSLVPAVAHMWFAKRGTRTWVFVEYGSTSLCLWIFLLATSAETLFPGGLVLVFVQSILLGIVGTLGRALWTENGLEADATEEALPAGQPSEEASPAAIVPGHRWRALRVGLTAAMVPLTFCALFGTIASFQFDDLLPFYFFGAFGLLLGISFGVGAYWRAINSPAIQQAVPWGHHVTRPYQVFADRVGGTLFKDTHSFLGFAFTVPRRVEIPGPHGNAVLETEIERRSEKPVSYERLGFEMKQPTGLDCRLYPQTALSDFGKVLGMQDIETGWEVFDSNFVLKAEVESQAVLPRRLQERILLIRDWLLRRRFNDYLDIRFAPDYVVIRIRQLLQSDEDLMSFYELSRDVIESIEPTTD